MKTKHTPKSKLTYDEKQALLGLIGFIRFAIAHEDEYSYILGNLAHDVNGLMAKQYGDERANLFVPRTKRYTTYAGGK